MIAAFLLVPCLTVQAGPQSGPDTLRLTLRQAMEAAQSSGYAAQAARSRSAEARSRVNESRAALLPHFGASAFEARRSFDLPAMGLSFPSGSGAPAFPQLVGPFNVQDARVNGRLSLIDVANWKRYAAARGEAEGGGYEAEAAAEGAELGAAEAYLALERARALVASRHAEASLATQLAELSRAQQQAGAATRLETLRAEGQVSNANSGVAAAEGEEERARYVLLRAVGASLDAMPVLGDTLGLPEPPTASAAGAMPEVAAADARERAARDQVSALRAEVLPTVELSGDYGLSGPRLDDRSEWTENIALTLNWNLWDGGSRRARLAAQSENAKQAALASRDIRDAAEQGLRSASSAMRSLRAEAGFARERAALAEEEERLAREKFKSGASGNLEVISAQASVSLAHQAYIDAAYGYNRARLEYLRAAHRLGDL
ncbi:MAG: TolC family protein [Fibrobacteres bacterium]|nr:TolC family protein [Fibrobacterota bacterium]